VPLSFLSVQGYRSIRSAWARLGRVNVVLGANGSGRTDLYRSLALLVEAAEGRLARSVAREGGMPSLMWAESRPPELLALNEPETSLHPQLLAPLGRLIGRASRGSQLFVTTHSRELAEHIARSTDARMIELALVEGETRIAGQPLTDNEDDSDPE
jgi:predicted ATPase